MFAVTMVLFCAEIASAVVSIHDSIGELFYMSVTCVVDCMHSSVSDVEVFPPQS